MSHVSRSISVTVALMLVLGATTSDLIRVEEGGYEDDLVVGPGVVTVSVC